MEHGALELEGLISPSMYAGLRQDLSEHKETRNLQAKAPSFAKLTKSKSIRSIALELTKKTFLKFGLSWTITKDLESSFPDPFYFRQIFSYTGIAMGVLINLSETESEKDPEDIFPSKPMSATFFKPIKQLDFSKLNPSDLYTLLIFCYSDSRYKLNPFDPYSHDVKKEGQSFGDKLSEKHHPLIYS